ncbi:serine O-acetyltransferase [Variovorax sp. RHLX14]|uniref:serine O-acetyltransferase n=1 Tax=Variovorax sp. RHLX14 TaxID=1259731 RepID=UPI003F48973F
MTEPQEALWATLVRQAHELGRTSPVLAPDLDALVLEKASFADALCAVLSGAMSTAVPPSIRLDDVFGKVLRNHPDIAESAAVDLQKLAAVNPACPDVLTGLLSFRGFQALQLHRIDHELWKGGQNQLAVLLQNWGAIRYSMDIHPAARIGSGVFLDHGIGLVVGATAVIEDGANIWHGVTLGSTLTQAGDRHPKVRRNATICAGATVLGNIEIGEGAIVAAGSVVLKSVSPGMVVAGVPARVIGVAPSQLDAIDSAQKTTSTEAQEI